jgi:parvulin-like peptidyl-prolyl isomerase
LLLTIIIPLNIFNPKPSSSLISKDDILQQLKISCQLPTVVQALVEHKVIVQTAQAAKIQIAPEELQKAVDDFRLKNNLSSADKTFAWLQKNLLSVDDLETLARQTVLSAKVANHLFKDKVEPYFVERQLDYTQVVLYEVIFTNLDLAMELFYAIQEQEISFTDVARHYSQDEERRYLGGYCGRQTRQDLKPEISAAVFAAKPPVLLKPIVIGKQVHLVWVEAVLPVVLDDALKQKILEDLFANWLRQQTANLDYRQILDPTLLP